MSVNPVSTPAISQGLADAAKSAQANPSAKFEKLVSKFMQGINADQAQANQSVQDLATGKTDDLHEVVMSVAKADLSFRLMLEIRNRLIDSYQELMRMQV